MLECPPSGSDVRMESVPAILWYRDRLTARYSLYLQGLAALALSEKAARAATGCGDWLS